MKNQRQSLQQKFRALFGALAILLSVAAAPVALAAQTDDNVCAMACCVQDGHCCCKPNKAFVKGEDRHSGKSFELSTVTKPCPDGCANASSSSQLSLRNAAPEAVDPVCLLVPLGLSAQPPPRLPGDVYRTASSPRGPPSFPAFIAWPDCSGTSISRLTS